MSTLKKCMFLILTLSMMAGMLPVSVLAAEGVAEPEKSKNEQYIQDQIDLDTGSVILEKDVTVVLEKDFAFPNSLLSLWIEGTIIVPNGKTLTINSACQIFGSVIVEEGATLYINGTCTVAEGGLLRIANSGKLILSSAQILVSGTLDMAGTYELTGWNSAITLRMNYEGNGTILGIAPEELHLFYVVDSDETLKEALNLLESGSYLETDVNIPYDHKNPEGLILSDDLTVPSSGTLFIYANFTIPEGITVTNNGTIETSPAEKAAFTNNGILINHGTVRQSTYDGAKVLNNGTIENSSTMIVYNGLLVNDNLIQNNGLFTISASYAGEGVLENNGLVENVHELYLDGGRIINNGTIRNVGEGYLKNEDGSWEGNELTTSHIHTYTDTVTAPTCTEKGYTTYTCECGDGYVDNYVDATGHSFGEWHVSKEATVEAEGEERRDCACGHYETKAIPKVEIPTEGQCGGSLNWSFDKATGTLTITGSGAMWNFTISLKQKSADPVVPWAAFQSEIKDVILSDGLTSIGNNAFNGCGNLTEITIPASVTAIGDSSFESSGLKTITFLGDAPAVSATAFQNVTAAITYPQDNETWTEDKKQSYGGQLEWGIEEDTHEYKLGDVSHDGKINAKDSTLILQKVVGVLKDSATFCEACADVSGDGKLNAKDSTLILQVVVGLRDSFPAKK